MRNLLAYFAAIVILTGCGEKTKTEKVAYVPQFDHLKQIDGGPEVVKVASKAVVLIENGGTGFFISDSGLLMTNEHVIGSSNCPTRGCYQTLRFDYQLGEKYRKGEYFFKPVTADPALDFAVYQVVNIDDDGNLKDNFSSEHHLTFNDQSAEELSGATIYLIGHPGAALKKYSKGEVLNNNKNWFSHSCFGIGGNSGSPIINEDGTVMGIHHRSQADKTYLSRNEFEGYGTGTLSSGITASYNPNKLSLTSKNLENTEAINTSLKDLDTLKGSYQIFENRDLFINSRTRPEGDAFGLTEKATIFDVLNEKCEESLLWKNDRPADDFASSLYSRCLSYNDWLSCQEKDEKKYGSCPDNKDSVRSKIHAAAHKIVEMNQRSPVWSLIRSEYALNKDSESGDSEVQKVLEEFISKHSLKLDYRLASARVWYSRNSDDLNFMGTDLIDYVRDYSNNMNVPHDAYWVADTSLGLYYYYEDHFSKQDVITVFNGILNRRDIPLGNWLDIEAMAYRYKLIE